MDQTITPVSTKGIIISLLLIVFALASHFSGIDPQSPVQYIGHAIFIGGIIWSIMSYGKQVDHNATFGNYFTHGFKVSALITAIMIIFMVVFIYLFPEIKENALAETRKAMLEQNLSEEQTAQTVEMTRNLFGVFAVGGTLLIYLIIGCIVSLIGAAITKKDPRPVNGDINQSIQ